MKKIKFSEYFSVSTAHLIVIFSNLLFILLIVSKFDSTQIGIWYTFQLLIGILFLFDLGVEPSATRFFTQAFSGSSKLVENEINISCSDKANYFLIDKLFTILKKIYLSLSLSLLILLSVFGSLYLKFITSVNLSYEIFFSWIIILFAGCLNLYFNLYSSYLKARGEIVIINYFNAISKIILIISFVIIYLMTKTFLSIALSYMLMVLSFRLLILLRFNKGYKPKEITNFGIIRSNEFYILKSSIKKLTISFIGSYLSTNSINILSNIFLPIGIFGKLAFSLQIITAIANFANTPFVINNPYLISLISKKNVIYKNMVSKIIGSSWLIYLSSSIVLLLIINFDINQIFFISSEKIVSINLILLLVIMTFFEMNISISCNICSYFNDLNYYKSVFLTGVISILIGILLINIYGASIFIIILSRILSQMIFNVWYWPYRAIMYSKNI